MSDNTACQLERACSQCSLGDLCLPYGLDNSEIAQLEISVGTDNPVARQQTLFAQGDRLTCLYAVSHGSFKTTLVDADGLEQVMGFYYPGDLLGLDGLADRYHHCAAIAVENSAICPITGSTK